MPEPSNQPPVGYTGGANPLAADSTSGEFIDLGRLGELLRRQLPLIFLVTLFCIATAVLYIMVAAPIYEATSTVELHTRRPRIGGEQDAVIGDDMGSRQVIGDALNTQFEKMQSATVRTAAATELRRQTRQYPELADFTLEELEALLSKTVSFERVHGTYLVRVKAEAGSPELARDVANLYADAVIEVVKSSVKATSDEAVTWLQEQIDSYEKELLRSEAELIAFRQRNNVDGLQNAKMTAEQSLMAVNEDLVGHETRMTVLEDTVENLKQVEASPESAGVLPPSIPRAGIVQERLTEYTLITEELDLLLTRYTPQHPKVVTLVQRQAASLRLLKQEIQRAMETAVADLNLVRAYVASLQEVKQEHIESIDGFHQELSRINTELIPLVRAVEASDSSYKGLLGRIEQARLAADEDTSVITLYEEARRPEDPVRPNKPLILAAALVLGVMAGTAFGVVSHVLRDRVYGPHDVEVDLKLDLLGALPRVRGRSHAGRAVYRMGSPDSQGFVEAISTLHTVLQARTSYVKGHGGWVILVSSVSPGEGKSSVSAGLASVIARTSRRVLLIDGDMRRPSLHKVFNMSNQSAHLNGLLAQSVDALTDANLAELPQATPLENLSMIPGNADKDMAPGHALQSGTFERLIEWARDNYDVVLIDSPPLGLLHDALVMAGMSDDVVLVARSGVTQKKALRSAARYLYSNQRAFRGVVLNGVPRRQAGQLYASYGSYYAPKGRS